MHYNSLYLLTKDEFGEPPASLEGNHDNPVSGTHQSLVNLCNRMGKERRRQTLCDKRDSNFVWNTFRPNSTFLQTDLFVKDQKTLALSEDHDTTHK